MFRVSRLSSLSSSSKSIGLFSPSLLFRATGTVKQWSSSGNFGFVLDDETEKYLLVPVKELLFADPLEPKRFLVPLQRVRYDKVPRYSSTNNNNNNNKNGEVKDNKKIIKNAKKKNVNSSSLVVDEMCVRVRDISGKALFSPLLMNGVSRSNQHLANNYLNNNNNNFNNVAVNNGNNIFGTNFGGVVTQLQGMFGFISSSNNHSSRSNNNIRINNNVKFCVRDVLHLQGNFHDYIRVGDRVTFDLVADPTRLGCTKCVNIRRDSLMSMF